ncbi:phosphatase PAP2 family protein [Oxalobacteraceae bacterium OM1]|nr:phosphatase PAP2 family protein [Oxalobacteraceae bacterium OM1]
MWNKITHFGDITIMAVAALAIAGWLLAENEKRLALIWALLFTIGMAIVVVTKIAFIGWGIGIPALDFTGFSGHATRAAAVLPVLAYLLFQRAPPAGRVAAIALGYGAAVVLGISRLAVRAHSPSEVVAGLLLGALISGSFILIAGSLQRHIFNPLRIMLVLLVLVPAPYVQPAPTQKWLTDVTLFFSGHSGPYERTGSCCANTRARSFRFSL